jgi:hypothetical protein
MENVTLEIIKSVRDRFKYPIITIYIIVLILWNWDVLSYYFLSDSSIETKINYIEKHFNQNWSRILCPLLKAIILAIGVPAIMLGIEYLLQKINGSRRNIKFRNNESIRNEKLAIAIHEFKVEQERTGKKTIEEWEEKVKSIEHRLDIQKLDNISLQKEKEELDIMQNSLLDELNKSKIENENILQLLQKYDKNYESIISDITEGNQSKFVNFYQFFNKIIRINSDGDISFNLDLTDNDRSIAQELIEFGILGKENRVYYATRIGTPFIIYCTNKLPKIRAEYIL